MANLQKKRVANEFGETIVTSKTQYISETRKDVLISRQTEAKMFKTLRYYNWSKSFGMKTPFLNNLANGAYGTLQLLNDLSAFTSDNVVRSLAARYGWVVAGRGFGKIQGRVLPQGGGPLGRFMRVKGGQFSRRILGDFMNYFTTTEMEFENVVKTQKSIIKQLDMAGGLGPTWSAMALAEAIGNAPDPYASQAVKIRGNNRDKDLASTAFADGDKHTVKYLQKRTEVLKSLSASGASAPEMTYIIQAMEHGYDPDDIMKKVTEKDKSIKKILNPLQNQRNNELKGSQSQIDKFLDRQGLTDYKDDGTAKFQNTVFEALDEALGLNLSSDMSGNGGIESLETIFQGIKADLGGKTHNEFRFDKTEIFSPNLDKPKVRKETKKGKNTVITHETANDLVATDYYNYREVYSSNDIREDNYIASRPQIIKGLRIMDTEYLHAKNPKGGFLVYGIEFFQHKGIRDIQQIEFGGPATDKKRSLKKRLDRYVYPRSMFLHQGAQEAANKLGIDAKLKFSKRTSDVLGTVKQRRTKFLSDVEKGDNKKKAKNGEFSLIADMKLRNAMKNDLIRARNPRVKDGNKVDFKDISLSENLIQSAPRTVIQEYKGYSTIYVRDPQTGTVEPMRLDKKDYPKEYLNAFDRLEKNLKNNLDRPGELAHDSYLYRATNIQDAELRESINLDGNLGVNEFGNRRYQAPSNMRRQNYAVRGGVNNEMDIIEQAIANAAEQQFPIFWEELSAAQIDIEEAAEKIFQQKMKQIDRDFKKKSGGSKDARRRAISDAEFERDKMIDDDYKEAHDRIHKKLFDELNVDINVTSLEDIKNPFLREEIRKIQARMEKDIRGSGVRKFPYQRKTMVTKMKRYARAKNEGNDSLADEIFNDLTNEGRIDFKLIQQETGLMGRAGRDVSQKGEPWIYEKFDGTGFETINLDYQFMDGTSRMGPFMEDNPTFAAIAGGVDGSDISNINNYRDLINEGKKNAQGLNKIEGVGGNVNKSKTNKYGDPTVEQAMGSLAKISNQLGFPPELVDALSREVIGKDKTGKPVTSYGKGITQPFIEVRNILRGIERRDVEYVLGRALSGDALESLNDGAGRASRLKKPLTKLVNAAHQSEDGRNLLAFMCALEPDPFVIDVIHQVFDPNSKFAKRATGQATKRPSGAVSQRFGSTVDLSRAEINRLRAILQNTDNMIVASWRDILFGI